ncbi:MAG: TPM domain-containing protein [Clostridia bacterium]|nr:TPM domain-containing protein [Clostridia bacterium]
MKKRLVSLIIVIALLVMPVIGALAYVADGPFYHIDEVGYLNDGEWDELAAKAKEFNSVSGYYTGVEIIKSLNGEKISDYHDESAFVEVMKEQGAEKGLHVILVSDTASVQVFTFGEGADDDFSDTDLTAIAVESVSNMGSSVKDLIGGIIDGSKKKYEEIHPEPSPDIDPVPAPSGGTLVFDYADLITDDEEVTINQMLLELTSKYGGDHLIVTIDDAEGKSSMEYADDFFDYNGYGPDGDLLLINMEDRSYWMSTTGEAIDVFTDNDINFIGNMITSYLSGGDYFGAFKQYITMCDAEYQSYREQKEKEENKKPRGSATEFLIDKAGVIDTATKQKLEPLLMKFREKYKNDLLIYIYEGDGYSIYHEGIEYFEYEGYDLSGCVLAIDSKNNDFEIIKQLETHHALDEKAENSLRKGIAGYLKKDNYEGAVMAFMNAMDQEYSSYYRTKDNILGGSKIKYVLTKWWRNIKWFVVTIVYGAVSLISFLVTGKWKSDLKSAKPKYEAQDYISGFNLTNSQDIFLYSHTMTERIVHEDRDHSSGGFSGGGGGSSTHVSSSGTTHGGGGGHF